jgi:predicted Fe-Mo cluster-binding NifX family protein
MGWIFRKKIILYSKRKDMTKIAVASDDQRTIAHHFGRTKGFMIYTVENNKIAERHYVHNTFTGHAQGHHHDQNHRHQQHHSHRGILDALKDTEVVISRGMGRRLLEDFERVGKTVFVTVTETTDDAVTQYIDGVLKHDPDKSCSH